MLLNDDDDDDYLEETVGVQGPTAHCWHLAPVWTIASVGDSNIHHLGDGRVGGSRGDERHGGGRGIVGHHRLLDLLLHVRDVPQTAHCAHALVDGAAGDEPGVAVVDHQGLVHVAGQLLLH